jgi:hypothetical protein
VDRAPDRRGGWIVDPIGAAFGLLHSIAAWFQGLAPGGFGLLLVPLGILGALAIIAAIKR